MTNLPAQPTPFIGRRRELREIERLLADPACRLLTLLGPGGVGKTRLALKAAETHANRFRDGAFFVPLQGIQNANDWVSAVSDALAITFHGPEEPEVQLIERLRERALLLILDNMEHLLIEPGAERITRPLSNLVRTAEGVKVIVTSRQELHLQEEWVLPVGGLSFAPDGEAIALFLARARQARATFSPEEERADLERICAMVEGYPLALELAAAWTSALSCRDIADEIERDLGFLASRQRNVPQRHMSMQAVFGQSWSRLDEEERRVLRQLSVFPGGCGFDAARQVAAAGPHVLAALTSASLLRHTTAGRYELHELLRQYAAERLAASPEEREMTLNRHATYYLALLPAQLAAMQGSRQKEAADTLSADFLNILAGWRRAIAFEDTSGLLAAAEPLAHYCELTGRFRDGLGMFELALTRAGPGSSDRDRADLDDERAHFVAQMQTGKGMCLLRLGRFAEAEAVLEEAVSSLRTCGADAVKALAFALHWQGHAAFFQGRYETGKRIWLESLDRHQALEDTWGTGATSYMLANAHIYQGALDEGETYLALSEESLSAVGDRRLLAFCLTGRGYIAYQRGEYARAERAWLETLSIRRALQDPWSIGYSTRDLGYAAIAQGDLPRAKAYLAESLALFEEIGAHGNSVFPLDALGVVARIEGDYAQATALHRRALAISEEIRERRGQALCLYNLGYLAALQDDPAGAEELLRTALQIYADIGHRIGVGDASGRLGSVIGRDRDRLGEAAAHFSRALDSAGEIGADPLALDVLLGMAAVLGATHPRDEQEALRRSFLGLVAAHPASTHEMKRAAERLLGEASELAATAGQAELADAVTAARQQLEAWQAGAVDSRSTIAEGQDSSLPDWLEPLTDRETEVLQLIEQGLSNREIAEQLVLTVGTVKWYTSQIYGKLGAQNRSEAAHIARQFGLLS
jgi:predicted ATPase/DNA-binding CsgD family transcriptional regulator